MSHICTNNNDLNSPITISLIVMIIIMSSCVMLFMSIVNMIPAGDVFKFYFAVILFIFMPGYAVLKLFKWHDNPVIYFIMSLLTGMAIAPILYWVSRKLDHSWIFVFVGICSFIYFLVKNRALSGALLKHMKDHHIDNIWWFSLLPLIIILLLLNLTHFGDLIIQPDHSYLLRDHHTTESIFHLGLINTLKENVSPSYPYLSGYNLSYHMDMHLLAEMFSRYTGIHSILITYYFLPLFYFILIVTVAAVFFYQFTNNIIYSALFGFTVFAGDLSFLIYLFNFSTEPISPYLAADIAFNAPSWSLFTLNGMLPAIPLLFGSLIVINRYFKEDLWKYLVLFGLFTVSAFRVKSSMGAQIIGTAMATIMIIYFQKEHKNYWKVLLSVIAVSTIIFIEHFTRSESTEQVRVIEFAPFNGLTAFLKNLNSSLIEITPSDQPVLWGLSFLLIFILYIIGSFGIKIYFIKNAFDFVMKKINNPTTLFILIFIISGFALSEVLFIGESNTNVNNGRWFSVQSIYLSGFFVIFALASINHKRKRLLLSVAAITLLFSGTLSFLKIRNNNQYLILSPQLTSLSDFITKETPPDSVIFEPLQWRPSAGSHLSGRSNPVALYMAFIGSQASKSVIDERGIDVKNFYLHDYKGDRKELLRKYSADYIITNKDNRKIIASSHLGKTVYTNDEYSLIKVNTQ